MSARPGDATVVGLRRLIRYSDVMLAAGVVAIVAIMIIPVPTRLLDVLITTNIAAAITILLVALYVQEPLQFSAFPSILLLATLFRLALNITSTRLILLQGDAGEVIRSFGTFVVGGNYVVGIIVFLILVVIQFVVITNGAGRVAEVAARFTLDAMPGKQMSIDADLNAGLISEDEARRRREEIAREADFYGAMDGASKFVKGDAIAGIVIIVVNIVGGIAIGAIQRGMPLGEALQTYALLTVGDGLVSQIPALLISTATGIIVTRSAADTNLGLDVARQILSTPRALAITGVLLAVLGLAPGLPKLPFFVGAAGLLLTSRLLRQPVTPPAGEATAPAAEPEDSLPELVSVDPLELEIGYGLIPMVDQSAGGQLLRRITLLRKQIAQELGMIVPTIRIRDNLQLRPNEYRVLLRGVRVAQGEIYPDRLMVMSPAGGPPEIEGIQSKEPAFGLPAVWVQEAQRPAAELQGYTVVDPASVITTHLSEVIRGHAAELLRRQDVQRLLDLVRQDHPAVVDELIPHLLSLSEVHQILQHLLSEGIPIRDLVTILETLGNHARSVRNVAALAEHARAALAPVITQQYLETDGFLYAMTLHPELSAELGNAIHPTDEGPQLLISPDRLQRLVANLAHEMERMAGMGHQPVLLVPGTIRLGLSRLLRRSLPNLAVLAFQEITPGVQIQVLGSVRG
jgi:flagellar biosynthesis protein FlhA